MKTTGGASRTLVLALGAVLLHQPLAAQQSGVQREVREQLGTDAAAVALDTVTASRLSGAFRAAASRALPAVVFIQVQSRSSERRPRGFGEDIAPSQGSGFIIDRDGHILTNRHVVRDAERVEVQLVDGRRYNARVIGTDAHTDVALIKVEPRPGETLQPIQFGDSDDVRVGDWVLALGNPLSLQFTVTAGIVSAKGRALGILRTEGIGAAALESFIQTDAAINPGNSGGPMVDLLGRVVGINSAISSPTGLSAGYGFAIPIAIARKVSDDLMRGRRTTP